VTSSPTVSGAAQPVESCRRLLVVTDATRAGRNGLTLPFRDGMAVELVAGAAPPALTGFDVAVIDCELPDSEGLGNLIDALSRAIMPGGSLLVVLPATAGPLPPSRAILRRFPSMHWRGVETLNGQPCVVLQRTIPQHDGDEANAAPPGLLLATADATCRSALATVGSDAERRIADQSTRLLEDRRRAESALLQRLDAAIAELEEQRQRCQGRALVVAALSRRRTGRAVLAALRGGRRLSDRFRRRTNLQNRYQVHT
jgi:hypothetical protein